MMTRMNFLSVKANLPIPHRARRSWRRRCAQSICLSVAVFVTTGCSSEPAISKGNVKLVEKLRAAVVAKKPDWLDAAAKQIDASRQQSKLSEAEYSALEPIIADARQGHWDDANARLTHLINAQHGR
jgi:hypothetical protein